ncbi:acyltransferase [Cryobacterium sp. TMS1-13-1]|uniref:acyltransferase family protein n=1 Tax=Cryobacterium sp. TMS1-13-1 TaxID=1259220 RepID=UPI00106D4B35|nr:acyltransferase [Cryobacterium sp. TMS1-13-1]TFD21376.1 acyltransferase [Cryobacterium sp. TMS1-13-1]
MQGSTKRPEKAGNFTQVIFQTAEARPASTLAASTDRLSALDGLRGVAALVVMLHHVYLVAAPALRSWGGSEPGSVFWWLSATPLKLLTAGSEAVLVFFVLSGLVVALPALRKPHFSWSGFLGGRIVRIYVPVWAALAIGTALVWLVPRDPLAVSRGSWVANSNATSTTAADLLSQMSLTAASYDINNVLWSLRWELAFALLLPLFIAVAVVARRRWWIAVSVVFVMSLMGLLTNIDALRYLPVFFIGTLMAVRLDSIQEWTRRRLRRPHARRWGIVVVVGSLVLVIAHWLAQPIADSGTLPGRIFTQLAVLGAAGLVLAAITVPSMRRVLDSRPSQWLGRISFSLYLIHVPILATLTFLLGDDRWWLVAVLTIPLALLAACAFHLAVERPSHRLARRTGQVVSGIAAKIVAGTTR